MVPVSVPSPDFTHGGFQAGRGREGGATGKPKTKEERVKNSDHPENYVK